MRRKFVIFLLFFLLLAVHFASKILDYKKRMAELERQAETYELIFKMELESLQSIIEWNADFYREQAKRNGNDLGND